MAFAIGSRALTKINSSFGSSANTGTLAHRPFTPDALKIKQRLSHVITQPLIQIDIEGLRRQLGLAAPSANAALGRGGSSTAPEHSCSPRALPR